MKAKISANLGWIWGFSEAVFFFVVPDVWITWAALESFKASWTQLLKVLAGSLLGGLLMFTWATRDPASSRAFVENVPFVATDMFRVVESDLASDGAMALLKGPMSGIPYKIYAVLAPAHTGAIAFMLASVPARLERMVASWLAFAALAALLRRYRPGWAALGRAGHAVFWIITYLFYWHLV